MVKAEGGERSTLPLPLKMEGIEGPVRDTLTLSLPPQGGGNEREGRAAQSAEGGGRAGGWARRAGAVGLTQGGDPLQSGSVSYTQQEAPLSRVFLISAVLAALANPAAAMFE